MIDIVNCRPGQIVNPNDLLFKIDPRSYRMELDKAEAEVRRAEARMKRYTSQLARVKENFNSKVTGYSAARNSRE